ncbi:MAG TPA: ATP-dependent helicase [Solirubrobacterales bacterium]|nr:ATP-dependent helicase [Solirubrobacterales bacterium]
MTDDASEKTPFHTGPVRWLAGPIDGGLEEFAVVTWADLRSGWIDAAKGMGMHRSSLDSVAQPWFNWLDEVDRLAVVGVDLDGPAALADLLGFVVEPATRRGIELVVEAQQDVEHLDDAAFVEPEFGYPYTLERLRWRLRGAPQPRQAAAQLPETGFEPDPTQASAVGAGEGVVQIIAPAGSGKTTVLVERVRELRRRGVPAEAIACVTFNRAAKEEMGARLERDGVGRVEAFTFHGLGRRILIDAGKIAKRPKLGGPSLGEWRFLAAKAKGEVEDGVWLKPSEAAELLSQIKLGELLTPEEHAAKVAGNEDPKAETMAALYEAYEELQRKRGRIDFDDLIFKAVLLLRENEQVRGQWQARYQHLLVDEYQDIEPAQELIVRIVAAPHDQLFCVGDEDQTLYAFRRASVERIICLDEHYPSLQRVSLGINYRCPARVVLASRDLIDLNRVRFPKTIEPNRSRAEEGTISLHPVERVAEDAAEIAKLLGSKRRGEIAVLARTTNALRPVALACADLGVPIDGNDKLFTPLGALEALQQHLRLALYPEEATPKLVSRVCQTPARSLNRGAEGAVAEHLRAGQPFEIAFKDVPPPRRDGGRLLAPGELFELLASSEDAAEAVMALRTEGGLDSWFEESDGMEGLDQFEAEVLERAEQEAAGRTPDQFLSDLEHQAEALQAVRDEEEGIELLTIHGSKGRQWPHVVLVACEEGILPNARALKVEPSEEARGEGIEGERRLAYVAFTRAQQCLDAHYDEESPSRFLEEAGVLPAKKRAARVPPPAPPAPAKGGLGGLLRRRD